MSVHAGVWVSVFGVIEEEVINQQEFVAGANAQTLPLLKAAVNVDPNPAVGGGDIIVEDGMLVPDGDVSEEEDGNSRTANGEISIYIVDEGDTLSQIAEMFDVSAKTILWANELKDLNLIQPGDSLVILPITGVRHVVKEGDTIGSIAKKYEGDVDDILAYNQLSSADEISVGDTVVVPGGEIAAPQRTYATPVRTSGGTAVVSGGGSSGFVHPAPGSAKSQGIHGYNGVDLANYHGAPILAAASGEVIVAKYSGWNGGYGLYVVVRHPNGTQTLYAHLSKVYVSVGERVSAGETIAAMGSTGRSTGTHLHFEVRGARNPF